MRYFLTVTVLASSILAAAASCGGSAGTSGESEGAGGGAFGNTTSGSGAGKGSTGSGKSSGSGAAASTGSFMIGTGGGGPTCATAQTCKSAGKDCGPIPDGCGGVLQCGKCKEGESCGGSGKASVCGKPACTKKTCEEQGISCGPAGDGCGGDLDCGGCSGTDTCGGGGKHGQCGQGAPCMPETCMDKGIDCGPTGDGCGKQLTCGSCSSTTTCGGGGVSGQCGTPTCVPQTCAQQNSECGPTPDGCGNLIPDCGACDQPKTCGGNGTIGKCEIPPTCTGLCLQQVTCPTVGGVTPTTTFSGVVYAPNGTDPLPNVLVYVPNGAIQPFTDVVSCDNCAASVTGDPLVSAVTDTTGTFQIQDMPTGDNIPIVIQTGRWRKEYILTQTIGSCVDNTVLGLQLNLPTTQDDGCTSQPCATNIPHMAFVTGAVDALECVMRKIGVADTEFTDSVTNTPANPSGRIHLYLGDTPVNQADCATLSGNAASGCWGANAGPSTQSESVLWGGASPTITNYDMVLFPCKGSGESEGGDGTTPSAQQQTLIDYANAGGRIFATHFSYAWFDNDPPFSGTAAWNPEPNPNPANQTGIIDTSFPKGQALSDWLQYIGASMTPGQIPVDVVRHSLDSLVAPSQQWMYIQDPTAGNVVMHFTFNTPIGAAADAQCGRVLFDDFHVEDKSDNPTNLQQFPDECDDNPMTPQEKLLEFMLFDLGSCVTPDIPTCTPKTCTDLGIGCGAAGDGCSKILDCGVCMTGEICGGGGPSQCGTPSCTAQSCKDQQIECGPAGDGCGGALDCGKCPSGQSCGGGGMPGKCGSGSCTKQTCTEQGIDCGPAGDGCGGSLSCGDCTKPGDSCGGGGVAGKCGTMCKPKSCADQGFNCGPAGDGCGNEIKSCGTCSAPQTCGGGGVANVCGGSAPH